MSGDGFCNLVVALFAEARPLIERLHLVEAGDAAPFRLFQGDGVRLVVTGVGRLQAAAACGYLHRVGGSVRDDAWLNVGVAGHATLALGSVRWVQSVREAADSSVPNRWFPQWVGAPLCAAAPLLTVDRPVDFAAGTETAVDDRLPSELYDMECSAFMAVCSRVSSLELVHAIKVVSDNGASGTAEVTPARVTEWIRAALPVVERCVYDLRELASAQRRVLAAPSGEAELLQQHRFSVTQQRELTRLLRRWDALQGTSVLEYVAECADGRAVLSSLRTATEGQPL
ncbi:MAG: hypothetical protein AAF581_12155 [Planctomycetota bacterium]